MLTIGSLFAGIGGFDLGLERAGMQVKWQVEIDPYCLKVLEKHWPHVRRYTDIKTVDWSGVEPVDLVCGGFPCQDLSHAGRRAGIDGKRSGLWAEFSRCVRALRPRYVIVENVPGLLDNRAMCRVLGDLAESGYDAEWEIIPAAAVGAPHLRHRVWVLAYPQHSNTDLFGSYRTQAHTTGQGGEVQPRDEQDSNAGQIRKTLADAELPGLQGQREEYRLCEGSGEIEISRSSWWVTEPDVGRVAHGVPARVDRLRGLGNAVVPQVVEWIGRQIVKAEHGA